MNLHRVVLPACFVALIASPAAAASFDCAKAATPFEHAICDNPDLSKADERLAKSFATAIGGLTDGATTQMKTEQRAWLDYAQASCTSDAKPLTSGKFDETGAMCLVDQFNNRSGSLEQSRMFGGHRFLITSNYAALQDPNEVSNPDSYWKVATHEMILPMLDSDDPLAEKFNRYVTAQGAEQTKLMQQSGDGKAGVVDPTADSVVEMAVNEFGGSNRITLEVNTSWYAHGGAHGDYTVSYLHYLVKQDRGLEASDLFKGKSWESLLADAAFEELKAEHGEWLQVESVKDIASIVIDPTRWDLSNIYGLTIQFEPYEVSSYAYGAPTITIPWTKLSDIQKDDTDAVLYGQ